MLSYPAIDPILIQLGPVAIRWYGLMYVLGFCGGWLLGLRRSGEGCPARLSPPEVGDLMFYGVMGVLLGGRLGYVLFYQPAAWLSDPLLPLRIWEGGMSFHGGLLGVCAALALFASRKHKAFFQVSDFVAPLVPVGLFFGRLGNFINGELWGRPTNVPWGMVFPQAGPDPRHPSQLYEALLEGVVLFAILWWFSARPRARGQVSGLFLVLYGVFRSFLECFREPDRHLGFIVGHWLTMGQLLSLPMIAFGLWLLLHAQTHQVQALEKT